MTKKLLMDDETFNSLRVFLKRVADKEGPYSMNPLTHAGNIIDAHATEAQELLFILYGDDLPEDQR